MINESLFTNVMVITLGGIEMITNIYKAIDQSYDEIVEIRRYLHMHPEISFQEKETATYISKFYEELAIPYENHVGGNGVVAKLVGGNPGKTIALRADFDALPIQDEKDVPYKSTVKGVMHACGHDGHTAALLGLAKALVPYQNELKGTVVFLHQHAEEQAPGGARSILDSGVLDDVEAVFGTHLWSLTPTGTVQTTRDACMAGVDKFEISIQGEGGHGGYPHDTKDSIIIGAELVSRLQQIVSRKINPMDTAVVTIGEFKAGNAFNIIADQAKIVGTVRYFKESVQKQIVKEMQNAIAGINLSHEITAELDYEFGYPPLINHKNDAEILQTAAAKVPGVLSSEFMEPNMAGEDFAYYMQDKKGAFFFTGAQLPKSYPHHHPKFDFDEAALPIAAKTLFSIYDAYQNK